MPGPDHLKCVPSDILIDKHLNKYHIHRMMRFDEYCKYETNLHNCDDEEAEAVGPVHSGNNNVFYFSYHGNLSSSRFEFHKNKRSPNAYNSFVYKLKELEHIELPHILDYLESDSTVNLDGSVGL